MKILTILVGVFVVISVPIATQGDQAIRVLDLFGTLSLAYVVFDIAIRGKTNNFTKYLITSTVLVLFLVPIFISIGDVSRAIIAVRAALCINTSYVLAVLCKKKRVGSSLLWGLWLGAAFGLLIALGQAMQLQLFLSLQPPDLVRSAALGIERYSGIWGHPNTTAQVTMAGAAAVFALWSKERVNVVIVSILYISIAVGNYIVIQNRAPIVVALLIVTVFAFGRFKGFGRLLVALGGLGILASLAIDPVSFLGDRWTGNFGGLSTFDQGLERLSSTMTGMWLAVQSPFGLGTEQREVLMSQHVNTVSTHNGFVFAAVTLGPIVAIFMLWPVFRAIFTCFSKATKGISRFWSFSLLSVVTMLFFEDAIFEPSVLVITLFFALSLLFDEDVPLERV